jgi:membrane-anchored glycerophosphoryl diester phosphodiesterase (GDPDase)
MRVFTSVHLLLLAYVVAALVYWGILLQQQNNRIFDQQTLALRAQTHYSIRRRGFYFFAGNINRGCSSI